MTAAYMQFSACERGPFQTIGVPVKVAELGWQRAGLTYTATGYGKRIPSRFMVQWAGRWRRVYVTQYGNAGSAWVWVAGKRVEVDIWQ